MRTLESYLYDLTMIKIREGKLEKYLTAGMLSAAIGIPSGLKAGTHFMNNKKNIYNTVKDDTQKSLEKRSNIQYRMISQEEKDKELGINKEIKTSKKDNSSIEKEEQKENIFKPQVRQSTLNILKNFEGFRSKAYYDSAGKVTIGYGFTKNVIPGLRLGHTITKSQADQKLFEVLKREYEPFLYKTIKVPITQNQFDALISWAYNVGMPAVKRSTLLKKINSGKYESAAQEFLKWNWSKNRRIKGLSNRRQAEKEIFSKNIDKLKDIQSS